HRHLPEGGSAEAGLPADRLAAEDDMDAEGAALADEAVDEQGGVLRELVVLAEHLLELVDDEQDARHPLIRTRATVGGDVLHAGGAEEVAAPGELLVEALEDTESELAIRLHGDRPCVRKLGGRVGLELHATLEVDEVKLELVGRVPEGEVGDERVQQRALARTGLARDERVLRNTVAEAERLEACRPGAPDGYM